MNVNLDSSFSDTGIDFISEFDRLKEMKAKIQDLESALSEKISFHERSFQDWTHLAEKIKAATVFLKVTKDSETMYSTIPGVSRVSYASKAMESLSRWEGSGFLVDSHGLVVTNYHVVEGASKVDAVFNATKKTFAANVIGVDPDSDLALLKIEGEDFPYLKIGESDKLKIGQKVATVGNPLAYYDIMTVGIVSGMGENLGCHSGKLYPNVDRIISNLSSNPGNSGGPLLNLDSEVIGVISGGYLGSGLVESIPSNTLKHVLNELQEKGFVARSYLGAELTFMDVEFSQLLGLGEEEGILVMNVENGSAAQNAGLQKGDFILKANGKAFESVREFRNEIAMRTQPGDELILSLIREGKCLDLPVILGSEIRAEGVTSERLSKIGIHIEDLNAERAKFYGYDFDQEGVIISKLQLDSPADRAGLFASFVITGAILGLNTQMQIKCIEDFEEALKLTEDQKVLVLQVRQPNRASEQIYPIFL